MTKAGLQKATAAILEALVASLRVVAAAGPADAAFAGGNGKISFYRSGDVWAMNADGTGATKLTADYNTEGNPATSPDGLRIACEFLRGIWVMNADAPVPRAGAALHVRLDLRPARGRARPSLLVVQKTRHRSAHRRSEGALLRTQGLGETLRALLERVE